MLNEKREQLQKLKKQLEDRQAGCKIIQGRIDSIQYSIDHFDKCAHDDYNFTSDFETFLVELDEEFNDKLRSTFGCNRYTILQQCTSQNNFDSEYNDFVEHHVECDRFDSYNRLTELLEKLEEHYNEVDYKCDEIQDQIDDLEAEIADLEE